MPTHPLIERIRNRTPLYTKVSVSKTLDFAEEVSAALVEMGISPEELAARMEMPLADLLSLLSGMNPFYDQIARVEAALGRDVFVGATHHKGYFNTGTTDASVFPGLADGVVPIIVEVVGRATETKVERQIPFTADNWGKLASLTPNRPYQTTYE